MAGRSGKKLVVQAVSLADKPKAAQPAVGTKEEIEAYLWNVLRSSTETRSIDVACDKCPGYKHRVEVTIAGGKDGIAAAKELLDRLEGRPGQQKPKEPPKRDGARLEDLSDEELQALADAGE